MGDPLADLMPNPAIGRTPENQIDWEMWLVKNDSPYDFSIPINDSKNPVPINFKAGQTRAFPIHLAKWLAMQIAQRIVEAQWKEIETTGKKSNLLLQAGDPETMRKKAALLLLGKEEDFKEEPIPTEPVKKILPEGLRKYQEERRAAKK